MKKIRVFEAFAGIGAVRMALERLGGGVECDYIGISEIDKFAIKSYEAIHGKTKNYGDISKIDVKELPDFDLFVLGFPCQDLSLAGLQKGFKKGSETRSSLLWECEKIIEEKRPKYLLMENVKALTFKKNMPGFEMWLKILEDLGYTNYWKILNAKDYGVPQNRERVYCISIHGDHEEYEFPEGEKLTKRLRDVLEEEVDEKYYLRPEQIEMLTKRDTGKYNRRKNFLKNIGKEEDVANTVQTRQRTSPDDTYVVDEETVERIKDEY